jgi:acylphosphatase
MDTRLTKRVEIRGHVQGVGYRASFEERARELKLSGWVRNRRDGSVEALVAGDANRLAHIISWAWLGPPSAEVDDVAVIDARETPVEEGKFSVLPTA